MASCLSDAVTLVIAKVYLVVSSLTTLGLSSALIAVGARKVQYEAFRTAFQTRDARVFLVDPYVSIMVFGALTIPLSLQGVTVGVWAYKKTAFVYFCGVLVAVFGFVYVAILCFLSAQADSRLAQTLAAYFDLMDTTLHTAAAAGYTTSRLEQLNAQTQHMLNSGGGLCVAVASLLTAALACASRVVGHVWMSSAVGVSINALTLLAGCFLVYVSHYTTTFGKDSNAEFGVATGVITLLGSLVGVGAFVSHWPRLVNFHAVGCAVTILLLVSVAAACFAAGGATKPASSALRFAGACTPVSDAPPAPSNSSTLVNATAVEDDVIQDCMESVALTTFASTHLLLVGAVAALAATVLVTDLSATVMLILHRESSEHTELADRHAGRSQSPPPTPRHSRRKRVSRRDIEA